MSYVKKTVVAELEQAYLEGRIDLSEFDKFERSGYSLTVDVFIYAFAQLKRRDMTLHEVINAFKDIPMNSHNNRVYVEAIYRVWADFESLVNREDNLLVHPPHSDSDWRTEFKKALIGFVVSKGSPVMLDADTFQWEDFFVDKSSIGKPVAVFNLIENDSWVEFVDTLTGTETSYGITADVLFDSGYSRLMRVTGELGEIVRQITA